jgi:hypothetical protein
VGRTEHGGAINFAAIIKFTQDQAGLNRLSDSHIISNQEANDIELKRHQQRHELIGSRLETNAANATEWTGATSQG